MDYEFKPPSPTGSAEHIERLKRDYIESTISLVESFARQATRYREQGDGQAALEAQKNFECFCRLVLEMIDQIHDRESAERFLAQLRRVGCDPEDSRYVA